MDAALWTAARKKPDAWSLGPHRHEHHASDAITFARSAKERKHPSWSLVGFNRGVHPAQRSGRSYAGDQNPPEGDFTHVCYSK